MAVKAVVFDLDGTLLTSEKKITERSIHAMHAAKAGGLQLVFATARPPRAVSFDNVDLSELGTVVYYNGALFQCNVTNHSYHHCISRDLAGEVIDYCLSLEEGAQISIEVKNQWYSYKALECKLMTDFQKQPDLLSLQSLKSYECTKILLADFKLADKLIHKYHNELNILVTDDGALVQIMSGEASKENAIQQLCGVLGIELKEVMCFGDDFNDVGLFKACGYPVAMGNAIPLLKDLAVETTDTNDNNGVAVILERLTG